MLLTTDLFAHHCHRLISENESYKVTKKIIAPKVFVKKLFEKLRKKEEDLIFLKQTI